VKRLIAVLFAALAGVAFAAGGPALAAESSPDALVKSTSDEVLTIIRTTKDKKALRDAIANLDFESVVGRIRFKGSPIKSIAVTELCGGQWRKTKPGAKFPYELVIVHNGTAKAIPVEDELRLISQLSKT
jgi:hypothetical protein